MLDVHQGFTEIEINLGARGLEEDLIPADFASTTVESQRERRGHRIYEL
jgi:hypothetical protein